MTLEKTNILIEGLRFHAFHGVMPQENVVGHEYVVDIRLGVDFTEAMMTDELEKTVNYASVYNVIKSEMSVPSKLIEHVAGRIVESVFATFSQVNAIELKLRKINPPMEADCHATGVEVKAKR